jgi:hypothetical protein
MLRQDESGNPGGEMGSTTSVVNCISHPEGIRVHNKLGVSFIDRLAPQVANKQMVFLLAQFFKHKLT